ncbi:MAG: hypothetical protein JRJ84_13690 [Deltaproteobacteria bacterium]|nr:hypothetical protein [Deltaproteobacteria bacterium]
MTGPYCGRGPHARVGLSFGMTRLVRHICEACGAPLNIDEAATQVVCSYCGARFSTGRTACALGEDLEVAAALGALEEVASRGSDLCHISEETVPFDGCDVLDEELRHVAKLRHLETLRLYDSDISDAGLAHLGGLSRLRDLDIGRTRVTDAGLQHLSGLTGLRKLGLSSTDVSDIGMHALLPLSRLRGIELRNTNVTEHGLLQLLALPRLNEVEIGFSDLDVPHLLRGGGARFFEDATFLDFDDQGLCDDDLALLVGFTKLENLYLSDNEIVGPGLVHLKGLRRLEVLYINDNPLIDEGLEHLRGFEKLRELSVNDTEVTNAGVRRLKRALPRLGVDR